MEVMNVKIRHNTNCSDDKKYWRVIIDDKEHLASDVMINVTTRTTRDDVFDSQKGEIVNKHHISCKANSIVFKNGMIEIW
jgi:hypothetical protein